ncbi:hypothetical protein niasHS_003810 [Heterodera schachtii]|uniref:Trichohyalin n=1 Tax=Heterodera schachtii TaxID=97005 RepID=A0ABD2K3C2_HETSC
MSAVSSFCTLSSAFSPLCSPFSPSLSINSLAHFLFFPQSLNGVLPIIFLLLLSVLLFSLLPSQRIKKNFVGESPREKSAEERELFSRKANGSNANVVPLPTICLASVSRPSRDLRPRAHLPGSVPVPMPMLLFTPSVGFVDLRRKVMSVPNLVENIGETDERPSNSQRFSSFGISELQQISSDLWFTRRRIEAGLREQRKQKAILEHVQEKLLRSRLRHANWRSARSHSPPNSSARSEETERHVSLRQQRPNTSWGARPTTEGPNNAEFGVRIGQLEKQLEHLQALASQTLLAHFRQSPHEKTNEARKWPKIKTELAKLRQKLMEYRTETADEFANFGNELTERLAVTLARRTRRELAHLMANRRGNAETEELRKRCALLEEQKTKLTELRFSYELRLDESETRRATIERTQSQIWTILGVPAISAPESLPSAVRKAIDAEKHRWEAQRTLMEEKMEAKERERREEHAAEKRESLREMSRREAEWADERTQHRREVDQLHAEMQETRKMAECRETELIREHTRADEAEREAHARAKRVEDEMTTLAEAQRKARARAEAEFEAERARSSELMAQRTHLETEIERKDAELSEGRENYEEALRERDELAQALHEAKLKNAMANSECERLMEKLRRERNDAIEDQRAKTVQLTELQVRLAALITQAEETDRTRVENDAEVHQRMAEADAELETLKGRLHHAEQRLRTERETRLTDAERCDKEWEEQERIIGKLEAEKECLQQRLVKAVEKVQHALGEHPQTEAWRQRAERLQQSLTHAEAEAAESRRQTEELMDDRERCYQAELDRAKAEISNRSAELAELRENEAQLKHQLSIAEFQIKMGKEMYQKLIAELDDLSERSVAQNSSTEQLRTELNETNDEIVLLRRTNGEQKGRNAKLEAELIKVEKAYNRERELRIKTEENLKRKELEAQATEERRLSEQRMSQLTYERLSRMGQSRNWHEEAGDDNFNCKHEKQIHASIDKWGGKIGIKTMQKRTDAIETLNELLNELWDKCERWEKRKEKAEEESIALNGQLCDMRKHWKDQQNELATRQQQIDTLREKLTKSEREAQREKDNLERKLQQWEETARREKAQMEAKLIGEKNEHSKALIRRETENKFISNSLEELRNENLTLKQKMEKQRIGEKCDDEREKRISGKEEEAEMAIIKAELCRERAEKNRRHSELSKVHQELMQSLQKAEQLQKKLDREMRERTKEREATDILQKREIELTAQEAQMHANLSILRAQWRVSVQSEESVRRALRESEATCRELNAQLQRAERESNAQKQHIDAMEMDRKRVEAVIRQTTLERNALTKALDAMEAENAELQRQCIALRTQMDRIGESDRMAQKHMEEQQKRIHRLETELTTNDRERRKVAKTTPNRTHSQQQIAQRRNL